MKIQRLEEFAITRDIGQAIYHLLRKCFPDYPEGRIFFKQLPAFRFLAWKGAQLIGHMAVEHRMVNNNGPLRRIFGIVDLCVAPEFQHQRVGRRLLEAVEELGRKNEVEFLVLLTNDQQWYAHYGFQLVETECRWLLIHDDRSFGIVRRRIDRGLMVKPLLAEEWLPGPVDFLGYIF